MNVESSVNALLLRYNKVNDYRNFISRTFSDVSRYGQRKKFARELLSRTPGGVAIDPAAGYVVTVAEKLEGLPEVVPLLQKFAENKLCLLDLPKLIKGEADRGGPAKPFYFNILTRHDLRGMPQVVDFALSDPVLKALVPYYNILPELSHMAVFVSGFADPFTADSSPLGTQCLHVDNHDLRHVKLFCLLSDVGEKDGPLTLLPADKTAWLLKKTGRRWKTPPFRDDKDLYRYFGDNDLVRVTGPAGTLALVDTTKCLHYGSRCQDNGRRTVFVIHYTLFADYSRKYTADFQDLNLATSPEFRSVAMNKRASLVYRLVERY